jgi:predicted Zn-dependent peptidase
MFQSMRERAGLVYSVFSHVNFWSDAGAVSVYFSVDPRNLEPALDIFEGEVDDIRSGGLKRDELEGAKAQLKGSIILGMESAETRIFRLIHEECYLGGFRRIEKVLDDIDRIDEVSVGEAARRFMAGDRMVSVVCGPGRGDASRRRDQPSRGGGIV